MKSKDFTKRFKNMAAYEKWLDKFGDDVSISHVMNENYDEDWGDNDFEESLNVQFTQFKDEKAFEEFNKFLTQSLGEDNSALEQAARQNVENHIGDVVTGDDDPETIGEEVYVLAFDGVVDAGGSPEQGRKIAAMIRDEFTVVHETAGVGIYDPRSNKTADVGPDTLRKNAAKFGFKVSKGGVPPRFSKNTN